MKTIHCLAFAIDAIWRRKFVFFINIILMMIAFLLMNMVIHKYNINNYKVDVTSKMVQKDFDRLQVIKMNSLNIDEIDYGKNINEYIYNLKKVDNVEWAGMYYYSNLWFTELDGNMSISDILKDKNKNTMKKYVNRAIDVLYVDKDILNICDLELVEGSFDQFVKNDNAEIPVILGNKFKGIIKTGDILTDIRGNKYKVIGVLESGARYFSKSDIMNDSSYYTNLDDDLIVLNSSANVVDVTELCFQYINTIMYYVNDTKNISETVRSVEKYAEKYNLDVKSNSIKDIIMEYKENYSKSISELRKLMICIIILGILSVSCASIISVLIRKNEFGIMYSCGIKTKEITKILIIENILKVFLALILAFVIYCRMLYFLYTDSIKIQLEVQFKQNMWELLVISIGIIVLVSIVPIYVMRHISIKELVGDN